MSENGSLTSDAPDDVMPVSDILPKLQRSVGNGCLTVKDSNGRTRVDRLYQQGCSKIRLPRVHDLHSNRPRLQAVLINSSGGMTGGDRLNWHFGLSKDTNLSITTQACERIYKSSAGEALSHISIEAGDNTSLAWLPQETILFDKGRFKRTMEANLSRSCEALFVEPVVFGRKAMNEVVSDGLFHDRWRIWHGGNLIHAEDFHMEGDINSALSSSGVADGNSSIATLLLIAPRAKGLLADIRKHINAAREAFGDVSFWDGKLLVRLVAPSSFLLRQILMTLIKLMSNGSLLPRIWTT